MKEKSKILEKVYEFQLYIERLHAYFSPETLRALDALAKDMQHELLSEKGKSHDNT